MTGDNAERVVASVVEGLKNQPLALALVLINLLFIGVGTYLLKKVADRQDARTAFVTELVRECIKKE